MKPSHLGPDYGAQFSDGSVAAGFSRERMSAASAAELDERIREIVTPFASAGDLRYEVWAEVAWGVGG
jgi:hypothetical protein